MRRTPALLVVFFVCAQSGCDPGDGTHCSDDLAFCTSRLTTDREQLKLGMGVAVDGDTVLLSGAPGMMRPASNGIAYVYRRLARGQWVQTAELESTDPVVPSASDAVVSRVALSGDLALVGHTHAAGTGAVYVFERDPETDSWSLAQRLAVEGAPTRFGSAVATDGARIVVGARGDRSRSETGTAYVYGRGAEGAWELVSELRPSEPVELFGYDAGLAGNQVLIGAPGERGAVYVFAPDETGAWVQTERLTDSASDTTYAFGLSVAASGSWAIIGAPGGASDGQTGAAFLFEYRAGRWSLAARLVPANATVGDMSGWGVAITDGLAAVSRPMTNAPGTVSLFAPATDGTWLESAELSLASRIEEDFFGNALSLSRDALVVAAERDHWECSNVRCESGVAYVFDMNR